MTRETKIGMLVGLAFIIVIGILLSDHMTSTTEPAKAPLSSAGSEVRSGVTTPAAAPIANPAAAVQIPGIAPTAQVPTQDELASRSANNQVQNIAVGPGNNGGASGPIVIQQSTPAGQGPIVRTPTGFGNDQPTEIASNTPTGSEDLENWARKPPTEMTPVPAGTHDGSHTATLVAANAPAHPAAGGREYTVESGDTLSKLAGRFLGGNTKANRDAIIDANPTLKKDPNRLIVGKVYIIPTLAGAPKPATASNTAPVNSGTKPATPKTPADVFAEATTPVKPSGATAIASADAGKGLSWYTVSEGDNLWKIAAEQLGSGNDWTKIKDLNKDVLKGGDTVHPNMRLRIPQKGVASAN